MRLKDQRYRHDGYHQFFHPPVDSNDATLEQYARAFILGLIAKHLDQGLQDEALLDEGLPTDPLGCFMGALHGRLSCPSSDDISSRPRDLADDVTSYLI
ncbi:hypothetical protein CK203_016128 [Vitis vinifera]|uniref:Uncharacterized protein n=1 Tax=Vitis vinifera TaxID=29760 RepID=A0A438JMT4_VITVI|nr:hypothetical protein CK203_016128 [Vitis vinifera]